YRNSAELARSLAAECGADARRIDLADAAAVRALVRDIEPVPDVFIHCAAVNLGSSFIELTDADWQTMHAVNFQSAFAACQALAGGWGVSGGDIFLGGGLDGAHAVPLPAGFAAARGALAALTMALAKELGPAGVRVNMVAAGPLEDGLSRGLSPALLDD